MASFFTVSVDSVDEVTLRGKVYLVNPDIRYVPDEFLFPLALLVDAWWRLDSGYLSDHGGEDARDRYPLSVEQGKAVAANMRLRDEFAILYEVIHGRKVRVTKNGYLLGEDGKTPREPKRKAATAYPLGRAKGYDGISHWVMTSGDEDAFEHHAEDIITGYDIGEFHHVPLLSEVAAAQNEPWDPQQTDGPADLAHDGTWNALYDRDFPDFPYAPISVTVSDPGYLEHLVAGMRWDTVMTGDVH